MSRSRKMKVGEQRKVPQKMKDPRSLMITIKIGSIHFNRALCDLGTKVRGRKKYLDNITVGQQILSTFKRILDFEEHREIPIL
ncbi:hypothetical protein EPI10_016469 [Gossypium australe]|uniref:Uncharacterized protein n=1 Tax=Gossypium australe TaxID=47621 RepID=A0A5B6VP64_9ROSI|nr:hypothetical protein EPI10_016469 [Gossypium australe]